MHQVYFTTDSKRPFLLRSESGTREAPATVTGYSKTEPLLHPTIWAEATLPSVLWASGASVAAFSASKFVIIGYAIATGDLRVTYWIELYAAALAGAVAYMHHFRWRLVEYDKIKMRHEEYSAEPMREEPQKLRPTVVSPNGRQVKIGRFNLTHDEWKALATTILYYDKRVVRDVLARAAVGNRKVFRNITGEGVWQSISSEFERLGWVKNGLLTREGEQFCNQLITPPPA